MCGFAGAISIIHSEAGLGLMGGYLDPVSGTTKLLRAIIPIREFGKKPNFQAQTMASAAEPGSKIKILCLVSKHERFTSTEHLLLSAKPKSLRVRLGWY